jgi:3-oxoacyl-[acyl-carrier-protein] synthase II
LDEGEAKNVLVGGHDEMTDKHFQITGRIGYWKNSPVPTMELINSTDNGAIAGEGASFFVLSKTPQSSTYARVRGLKTFYKPANNDEIERTIAAFLQEKGLKTSDVDTVVYGINGDPRFDKIYHALRSGTFAHANTAYFKHLCGEYQTSGSFAMWAAAKMLRTQTIPSSMLIGEQKEKRLENVLIYNHFMNEDHSLILLSPC